MFVESAWVGAIIYAKGAGDVPAGTDGGRRSKSREYFMLMPMREIMNSLLNSVSTLMTQLKAAFSIPLADASEFGEHENPAVDGTVSWDAQRPVGSLFDCVAEHPGRMTRNGRGSLEIGAAHDD